MAMVDEKRWSAGLLFFFLLYVSSFWLWDRGGDFASWSDHLASDDWLQHRVLARKNIATITQAVGAFVAFYGLLRAYVRAKFGLTGAGMALRVGAALQRAWARLVGRKRGVTRHVGSARATIGFNAVAFGMVLHTVDRSLGLQEQIERLITFVNSRVKELGELEKVAAQIQSDVIQVRDYASGRANEVLEHVESTIAELEAKINSSQSLDLIPAIVGLFISAVGTFWGLGA